MRVQVAAEPEMAALLSGFIYSSEGPPPVQNTPLCLSPPGEEHELPVCVSWVAGLHIWHSCFTLLFLY